LDLTSSREKANNELSRRAIHDRDFRPIDLDQRIMNTAAREGRHDMLDCRDAAAGFIGNDGAKTGL
jgi:hypothetical protein